jgi:hypothetical protein
MTATLAIALCTSGQSGRRFPKQPRGSVPERAASVSEAARPPSPPVERKKPETAVRVYSNIYTTGTRSFADPQRLHIWMVGRLRRVLTLETIDGGLSDRSKASKQAKAEDGGVYVVLLELQNDPFQSSMSGRSYRVDATIYSPTSGKLKGSRRIELGRSRSQMPSSRNILLNCYPDVYGESMSLLEASIEAADFVLNTFHMPTPPICRAGQGI